MDPYSIPDNLLKDLQQCLSHALNSLGRTESEGLLEGFLGYSAKLINHAAGGCISLKATGNPEASRLLIRPAIEAMFKIEAVKKNPSLLYCIAHEEHTEVEKWVRLTNEQNKSTSPVDWKDRWKEFDEDYRKSYPDHQFDTKKLKTIDVAEAAGARCYYESHYRLYCQHSHATLHASSGWLDDFGEHDERTIGICMISALDALTEIGADTTDYKDLRDRFFTSAGIMSEDEGEIPGDS